MVLKAELHCHIEGAAAPDLVERQARKYGADPSPFIRDGAFVWTDFTTFLGAYDFSASLFRTEEDYALLAQTYLTSLAADGAIYSELFISSDHALRAGLSPEAYLAGLAEGVRRAQAATGIECRLIPVGVRHFGAASVEAAARFAVSCGEPLVTGFGL
nr:adenosine deaminase [Rhizobiaceae bacterium]